MSSADFSSAISVIALAVSLFTLWFTVLRRGSIRCTRPSFVAIKYDFVDKPQAQAKVVFRAVLFSTGKRGPMIEQLFIRVSEGKRQTEFSFWGHGHDDKLTRGSGLYVPETGVAAYHHFNPTDADTLFRFSGGTYSVELMASLVGRKQLVSLGGLEQHKVAHVLERSGAAKIADGGDVERIAQDISELLVNSKYRQAAIRIATKYMAIQFENNAPIIVGN